MKIDYNKEDIILSVDNVSLSYESGKNPTMILNDVSMKIHNITRPGIVQGQISAIIGRSGCGKSSLFNLLSGYLFQSHSTRKRADYCGQ